METYRRMDAGGMPVHGIGRFPAGDDAAKKRVLIVYTTEGKPDEQKNKVGQLFDQVCGDVFGEQKGDTFVIFKEHPNSNVCARGVLKTMDPKPPINPYRSQQ